jgi:hypothetical protein
MLMIIAKLRDIGETSTKVKGATSDWIRRLEASK